MSDDMFLLNIDTSGGASSTGVSSKNQYYQHERELGNKREQQVKQMRKSQPKTSEVNTEKNGLVSMNAELFNNRNTRVDKKKNKNDKKGQTS